MKTLTNRTVAGQELANRLQQYRQQDNVIILGLPRGGVPVAYEIAVALDVPLDVLVVRKLGLPRHKEFAMGAITRNGICILNEQIIRSYRISDEVVKQVAETETKELQRREHIYRNDHHWPSLKDQCVILVDDGLATGATMRAAIEAVRMEKPAKVIMAVPVAAERTLTELTAWTNESVYLLTPDPFYFVGQWYDDFEQTTDEEVVRLLGMARAFYTRDTPQDVHYPPLLTP